METKPPTKLPPNISAQWARQVHKVLVGYKPRDPERALTYTEDIRKLLVLTEANFRRNQTTGHFTDGTGDLFIQNLLKTLEVKK